MPTEVAFSVLIQRAVPQRPLLEREPTGHLALDGVCVSRTANQARYTPGPAF